IEHVLVVLTFLMFAYQPSAVVEIAGVVLPVDCTKLIPPAPYAAVYFTESAKYASSAVTRFRRSDFIEARYAFSLVFANFGIAMAARLAVITTALKSSWSVVCWRLIEVLRQKKEPAQLQCPGRYSSKHRASNEPDLRNSLQQLVLR